MDAIRYLDDPRIRLVVTGGGPSLGPLSALAEQANAALGRQAVVMTGELADPRPAYAAADIALGMGGSAQRSIAFGKPLVVLGIRDFAKPFLPSNSEEFLYAGFCGTGSDDFDPRPLASHIRLLADQPEMRSQLGAFGRQVVLDRLSLKAASAKLEDVYVTAATQTYPRHKRVRETMRVLVCRDVSGRIPQSVKASLGKRSLRAYSLMIVVAEGGGLVAYRI